MSSSLCMSCECPKRRLFRIGSTSVRYTMYRRSRPKIDRYMMIVTCTTQTQFMPELCRYVHNLSKGCKEQYRQSLWWACWLLLVSQDDLKPMNREEPSIYYIGITVLGQTAKWAWNKASLNEALLKSCIITLKIIWCYLTSIRPLFLRGIKLGSQI